MARTDPDVPNVDVAEETTPPVQAFRDAQAAEYGQYVAAAPIYVGLALAHNTGDPVPASNVNAHGWEAAGLVQKVSG